MNTHGGVLVNAPLPALACRCHSRWMSDLLRLPVPDERVAPRTLGLPAPGLPDTLQDLASTIGNSAFAALAGAGHPVDGHVRAAVERRTGVDLADVRVQTGPVAAA